ncbi:hypothetical protein GCM10010254_09620 [Streptomyces chromofuscus]|nr:hypothetical protein GCM10010254_09620 [Streptomyces chromofuscus]
MPVTAVQKASAAGRRSAGRSTKAYVQWIVMAAIVGRGPETAGRQDRTRTAMDAGFGGLRTGCGQGDAAGKELQVTR